jgi:hypothetical protein
MPSSSKVVASINWEITLSTIGTTARPPTKETVIARIGEFERVGRSEFLRLYSGGFAAKTYYVIYAEEPYDLKALFAASHQPPVSTRLFNTVEAAYRLRLLGFDVRDQVETRRFVEGKRQFRETSYFARHPVLVAQAKATHGFVCMVCKFDFEAVYGRPGHEFIECHHLRPLADNEERETTVNDVAVVCSNCHRMIHRNGELRSIAEMKRLLKT